MTPRAVVVAHREAMVAEGLAAALSRYPGFLPVPVASATEAQRAPDPVAAAVLDASMPGVELAAARLRRRGVRVVFLGDGAGGEDVVRVSPAAPVSALATAVFPEWRALEPAINLLTPREGQVLSLVARGFAAKQVARHLGISHKTVERHKTRIFTKLGVPNQAAAVSIALTRGLARRTSWL